ncbi:MAG: hypothetical protein HKO55_07955 [Gammaproteobacteria bacterium]|nr:hypothetical protein [Gammaproteobacteria bacterium]
MATPLREVDEKATSPILPSHRQMPKLPSQSNHASTGRTIRACAYRSVGGCGALMIYTQQQMSASPAKGDVKDGTAITLREGVKRHRAQNAVVVSEDDVSPEVQAFFRCHDVAHVVFGCDTTMVGEGVLKIFTIFGTTLGFRGHVTAYSGAGAFGLFRQYSTLHVLRSILRLLACIPHAVVHARRMSRRWPWADHSEYLDKTIEQVRREFNIVPVQHFRLSN